MGVDEITELLKSQSQSTLAEAGGYFTSLTLSSVSPTSYGTYHYEVGGLA